MSLTQVFVLQDTQPVFPPSWFIAALTSCVWKLSTSSSFSIFCLLSICVNSVLEFCILCVCWVCLLSKCLFVVQRFCGPGPASPWQHLDFASHILWSKFLTAKPFYTLPETLELITQYLLNNTCLCFIYLILPILFSIFCFYYCHFCLSGDSPNTQSTKAFLQLNKDKTEILMGGAKTKMSN